MKILLLVTALLVSPFAQASFQRDQSYYNPNNPEQDYTSSEDDSSFDSPSLNPKFFKPKPAENMPSIDISPITSEGANIVIEQIGGTASQIWALGMGGSLYSLSRTDKSPSWRRHSDDRNSLSIAGSSPKNLPVMTFVHEGYAYLSRLKRDLSSIWDKKRISKNPLNFVYSTEKRALGIYKGTLFYYPLNVTEGNLMRWHEIPPPQGYAYSDVAVNPSSAIARIQHKADPSKIKFLSYDLKNMRQGETMRKAVEFQTPVPFYSISMCPSVDGLIAAISAENGGHLYFSKDGGKTYVLVEHSKNVYRRAAVIDAHTIVAINMDGEVRVFNSNVSLANPVTIRLNDPRVKAEIVENKESPMPSEDENVIRLTSSKNTKDFQSGPKVKPAPTPIVYKAFLENVSESSPDYHNILGVPTTASKQDIQEAYKKYHSQMDLCCNDKNPECQKAMDWLEKAYKTLMDAPPAM